MSRIDTTDGSAGQAAAILLCAGKGTRMGDDSKNKVAYDCAGMPVVRRIVENMRRGGVSRFVVVVGHRAESVMAALDGERGVIYAYQKEQKGTGHAAMCGLSALEDIGFDGPVIVSMGDKIVSPRIVSEILSSQAGKSAVCGVQPREEHPNGGHVMFSGERALGIIEHADALRAQASGRPIALAGREFSGADALASPFVNTAFYCFDARALARELSTVGSDNAQGEIYLTDTIERFAARGELDVYRVDDPDDLLTYSTRPELRRIARKFLRRASAFLAEASDGRTIALLQAFIGRYGDRPMVLARAPGRVNLMGRHIEHRGGGVNVMAVAYDTLVAAAPRDDYEIHYANCDAAYAPGSFSVEGLLPPSKGAGTTADWLAYLDLPETKRALAESRGDWSNYVKSAVLRFRMSTDLPLQGMDLMASGNIPVAAGLSSSSSVVVAVAEALTALNSLNLTTREFVELCGEGEWFVGSRGGPGDHAAMKCSRAGCVTHLDFKPFSIGRAARFPGSCAVVVANSLEMSKKSEGSRDKFNGQVAAYELAFLLVKKSFPDRPLKIFRDLAEVRPASELRHMLDTLPERATRAELEAMLPESGEFLARIFSTHADPGFYALRDVAEYGVSEIARSASFMDVLASGDFERLGRMMKVSHDGDRVVWPAGGPSDAGGDPAEWHGAYACSTPRIDGLCDLLNSTPGVYGAQLVGAGLGGCVVALVAKERADAVLETLARDFYGKLGLPPAAFVCVPSAGSGVRY